jgi:hypothetical protein
MSTLKVIYFAYFHAAMVYDIFWRNLTNNKKVFLQQKRIVKIMIGLTSRTICKPSFQGLELLTFSSQYILSLMRFLLQNLEIYTYNSTIHGFSTINKLQLHKLSNTLKIYQKGAFYDGTKIFNKLLQYIAELVLRKMFHIKFEYVFN